MLTLYLLSPMKTGEAIRTGQLYMPMPIFSWESRCERSRPITRTLSLNRHSPHGKASAKNVDSPGMGVFL